MCAPARCHELPIWHIHLDRCHIGFIVDHYRRLEKPPRNLVASTAKFSGRSHHIPL